MKFRLCWMGDIIIHTEEELTGDVKERSEENIQSEALGNKQK